jgi:hypothetical protein
MSYRIYRNWYYHTNQNTESYTDSDFIYTDESNICSSEIDFSILPKALYKYTDPECPVCYVVLVYKDSKWSAFVDFHDESRNQISFRFKRDIMNYKIYDLHIGIYSKEQYKMAQKEAIDKFNEFING